jgi:sister-chromatid-cohesion protein PDS5
MLRELVEIDSSSRTEHGPTTSFVSVLSGILRGIQKAEDPTDSDITPVCLLATVRYVIFVYHFVVKL